MPVVNARVPRLLSPRVHAGKSSTCRRGPTVNVNVNARLLGKSARALGLFAAEQTLGRCAPFTAARMITLALRLSGVRIGGASIFWGMPTLAGPGDVSSRLRIGTYCGFNARSYFELEDEITIGDHVAVGQDVMFLTRIHDTS